MGQSGFSPKYDGSARFSPNMMGQSGSSPKYVKYGKFWDTQYMRILQPSY